MLSLRFASALLFGGLAAFSVSFAADTPDQASPRDTSRPAQSAPAAKIPAADEPHERPRPAHVLFVTTKDCPRCETELARLRRPGGEFDKLRNVGWKVGTSPKDHIQIVEFESLGPWAERLKERAFPQIAAVEGEQIVRSFHSGCTTPLDMWTFSFLAKGVDERPAGFIPEAARVETTGHYPLRGNHWSVDEDFNPSRERVISHLRGPVHGPQIAGRYEIESWSLEELRSLHDNLHEIEMGGVQFGGGASTRSSPADQFSATRKAAGT